MKQDLLKEILPSVLDDHFVIVSNYRLGDIGTKTMELHIELDEKNELPIDHSRSDYESKGFLPSVRVQDFPIRGKAVYLHIRRRRWRHKHTRKEISNDYSISAEGSRLTEELSAFLKATS